MKHLNLKDRTGSIRLDSGHALILGHKPDSLKLAQVAEKMITEKHDTQSLGLFDYATPNYSTYYPDVTAEDLSPKDADFIHPVFRMLSETILSKGIPIDFGKKGVLRNSMQLMVGQSVNIDHETALGNAVGSVKEVKWQNAYKTASGIEVPAGFNAVLKIDGKSNPRIARGIMMDPPSIHSNSVTVRFAWEPSHAFETDSEFYNALGTYHKDGDLVRLVVVEIKQYSETSLVGHGADPYAQKVGEDGKIINPNYADTVYNFSADKQEVDNQYIDYKDSTSFSFKADTIPEDINNNNNNNNKDHSMKIEQLIAEVEKQFGLESGSITVENFTDQLTAAHGKLVPKADLDQAQADLSDANDKLGTAEGQVTTLTQEVTTLTGDKEALEANAMPDNLIQATRDEAVRLYKLIKGDNVDETIVASINKMDYQTATSFQKQYQVEADEKFPDTCQDCKSTNISKASAQVEDPEDGADGKGKKVKTNLTAMAEIKNKGKKGKKSIALSYNK